MYALLTIVGNVGRASEMRYTPQRRAGLQLLGGGQPHLDECSWRKAGAGHLVPGLGPAAAGGDLRSVPDQERRSSTAATQPRPSPTRRAAAVTSPPSWPHVSWTARS